MGGMTHGFGIDIGGSGVKGAIVDLDTGEFIGERIKIATPQPSTPQAVAQVCREIVDQAGWIGPVGITVPAIVKNQHALSAANIDPSWVNINLPELFAEFFGTTELTFVNDADAAGIAEVNYGDERATSGSVVFLTLGTGIGSALLINGTLYPNSELGHLEIGGKEAEKRASSAVRERKGWSYKEWAGKLDRVMHTYEALFSPDAFIVGGGVSRKHEKWVPHLTVNAPVIPAKLLNRAGIVGAALAVTQGTRP